jgi:hypothetical protein
MQIQETREPLEDVAAELMVMFHLQDEPAPRGRLGDVDWILCGALSRLRARGKFGGERGAVALLSSEGKLKAERILVMGLGRKADLSLVTLYRLSYQVAEAVRRLRCTNVAVEPPFRAFPRDTALRLYRAFLEGFVAELRRGLPEDRLAITVIAPPAEA